MTAPAGSISLSRHYAELTLADCATFRTWVGAGTQAEALAHIYPAALPSPANGAPRYTLTELQTYRPFVIIYVDPEEGCRFDQDAGGEFFEFRDSGQLWLEFEQDVPGGIVDDPAEIDVQVCNTIGQILDDLKALAGQPGYLAITGGALRGYHRSEQDEAETNGHYVAWLLSLRWGAER